MTETEKRTTEKRTTTEKPSTTSGSELVRDVDPNSPEHKDAGQERAERENERERDES